MDKQDKLIARLFKDTLIIFLLSMFVSIIGYIIDGIIIGHFLGTESIAAFGITVPYQRFVSIFPAVLALGMQILCSKSLGRGDLREANGIFSLAITTGLAVMVFLTGATFLFSAQIADLLGAENFGGIRSLTIDYLESYSLSLPAMAAVSIFTPIMQLDSDRRRALVSVIVLSVSDIIADLISVFVFDGGIWGIGIATAISYWLAAGTLLLHFFKAESNFIYLPEAMNAAYLRKMISFGTPMILGRGSSVICTNFLAKMSLALAGGAGLAAYSAIWNLLSLLEIIPIAFSSAGQMIIAVLLGEQDKHSMLRLLKIALKYSSAVAVTMTSIIFLAASLIAELYVQETAVYQMTCEGIQWLSLFMLPCAIALMFQYYYTTIEKFLLANIFTVLINVGFIVIFALLLTPYFGITGLWMSFPLLYVALLLAIFFVTCRHCGRITFKLEDYLLLPADFGVAKDKQLDITVTTKEEVLGLSEAAQNFCVASGIDARRSMFAGVCIEEMAGNIVDYGFDDGKDHFVDVRVIVKGEQVIIRLRDDCRPFDPKKQIELYNPEDPAAHIGIRLVRKIATTFDYVNVLKLNNLIIKI